MATLPLAGRTPCTPVIFDMKGNNSSSPSLTVPSSAQFVLLTEPISFRCNTPVADATPKHLCDFTSEWLHTWNWNNIEQYFSYKKQNKTKKKSDFALSNTISFVSVTDIAFTFMHDLFLFFRTDSLFFVLPTLQLPNKALNQVQKFSFKLLNKASFTQILFYLKFQATVKLL